MDWLDALSVSTNNQELRPILEQCKHGMPAIMYLQDPEWWLGLHYYE
jgi:hypothetical protein